MLDAGYRKSTTRLSALVSLNPSPFAARGRLNLFDSKATLIRFFVGHRYRARLLEVRDDCRVCDLAKIRRRSRRYINDT